MAVKRYVKQNAQGSWDVLREGDRRATVHLATEREAISRASQIVRKSGGGRVLVVDDAGKISDATTVRSPKPGGTAQSGTRKTA